WKELAPFISNEHLETLKENAITVLSEHDPKFSLENENRFAANLYGKTLTYSGSLRRGIASTLILIGNYTSSLEFCSQDVRNSLVPFVIRQVFKNADWSIWGSLNSLLPYLAEADPDTFLDQVESVMGGSNGIFKKLFDEEGNNVVGGESYITGLLWGLETLAWKKDLLVRVSVILAELASLDPGGRWANRPI